jgi:hypothetical protein
LSAGAPFGSIARALTYLAQRGNLWSMTRRGKKDLKCSFCGKPNDRVRRLIGGPGVYICDDCVACVTRY